MRLPGRRRIYMYRYGLAAGCMVGSRLMVRLFFRYICCMVRRRRNMVCDMVHMLSLLAVSVWVLPVLVLVVVAVRGAVRAVARLLLVVVTVMGVARAVARLVFIIIAV